MRDVGQGFSPAVLKEDLVATKATPEDVMKLGFTFEMFRPTVNEEGEFTPFIQGVLDDNVAEVKALIGESVYNDALKVSDVKRIEVCSSGCGTVGTQGQHGFT